MQYAGIREEHLRRARVGAGIFDVSHMGEIETRGPAGAEAFLQHILSNDVRADRATGGAQYSVLCREDGGILDDLFTYRLADEQLPDGHQRGQPRARPGVVPASRPRTSTSTSSTASTTTPCSPSRARAPASSSRRSPTGRCRRGCTSPSAAWPAARRSSCGTGYTGEDGVELLCAPDGAPAVWDALVDGGATPAGLGARDTLRLEVCFHLYGNDLMRRAARSRPGWAGAARRTRASSAPTPSAPLRAGGRAEKLVPFAFTGPGHRRARATRSWAAAR